MPKPYSKSVYTGIKTIRQGDEMFMISAGAYLCPRAGFEITDNIPNTYRDVVAECITRGWLKPVAYMRDNELMWEILQK